MRPAYALIAVLGLATSDVRAEPQYSVPVYVTVVGTGSIRLRMAAGSTVPCDSSSNVGLYDGWVSAGRTWLVQSPWSCVCEQHTSGAFRETDFSPSQIYCQQFDPATGFYYPSIALTISTDG